MMEKRLKEAADGTPDPERSMKNLSSFLDENPSHADELDVNLRTISLLFSFSQFLANFCKTNPNVLFDILKDMDSPQDGDALASALEKEFEDLDGAVSEAHHRTFPASLDPYMTSVREFKMRELLRITLRDILRKNDLVEVMFELSMLADIVIEKSLRVVKRSLALVYGEPSRNIFTVISLGKLGGKELNFSSDIDLIFVYETETGETGGVLTQQGVTKNRISNHEYFCKLSESLTRFLSLNTEAGFAYRVDLRLRPEGQRGDIALSLRGYEMYYESWGRAWERAMLIRARSAAGDSDLGKEFIEMIRPFVYRKYLDFSSIDEIRRLKTRIDATFKRGDIKRGFGGIREIEFFTQALQLIYGGREPLLRERSTLLALHRLLQKALIGQEDYSILSDNYRYLRTLEHRLQQLNNLQTHTVPTGETELEALGKKMGFHAGKTFVKDLKLRRSRVRSIYDSLFAEKKEEPSSGLTFFDEELSDTELRDYLKSTGLNDIDRAVRNIRAIKDSTVTFQTLKGRRLLGEILPAFIDSALRSGDPDMALNHLQSFANLLSTHEAYLEIFSRGKVLIDILGYVFSQSGYLSKILMSRPQHLEVVGWEEFVKKSLADLGREIRAGISEGNSVSDAVRLIRQTEELRLGLLFLQKKIGVAEVIKGLSKVADAVISVCLGHVSAGMKDIAIIGFGKLGGREITFNSDMDIIFISPEEVEQAMTKEAERFLRMLILYTKDGIAYRVDTRLRPDGSKGPLVSSLEGLKKYYEKGAAFWEFQALLKARPVAGDAKTGRSFVRMAHEMLIAKGIEISASDIRQMRGRILRELSKESDGYDVKLGPGGIEDIEFTVQYLQLSNCRTHNSVLVQGTVHAMKRLENAGIMNRSDGNFLKETYLFYRTLESFLRLRGENVLRRDETFLRAAGGFIGFEKKDDFVEYLEQRREKTRRMTDRYLGYSH
jgi:[glutamine synthetase] adenylyltransferase / [glutamine synthetase]-adenylyl-L-tyrosine phosphorylase